MKINVQVILFFVLIVTQAIVVAAESCEPTTKIIGNIITEVNQPHELIEKNLTSDWLKFVYIPTKHSTITSYLTFQAGDVLNIEKVEESMRKLRATHFLWGASYEVIESSNCQIDILITVTDTFPFKPKIAYSHRSGANKYAFGIVNTNLLGMGSKVQIEFKHDRLRDEKVIQYQNPNFADGHYFFDGIYSENSDGKESNFQFEKPFHSLDSEYSYGLFSRYFQADLLLYNNASVIFQNPYEHQYNSVRFATGQAGIFGFMRSRLYFTATTETITYTALAEENRDLVSLTSQYQIFDTDFIEIKNFRNMSKVEDYNQGLSLLFKVGVSYDLISDSWGDIVGFAYDHSKLIDPYRLFISEFDYERQYSNTNSTETHLGGVFQFNSFSDDFEQSWNAKIKFDHYKNPRPEHYIIMDEKFSIRGYSYGQFLGDSFASLSLEKRWFNVAQYFDVVDVAAVAFFDTGFISVDNSSFANKNRTWLQSIGFGLRISPTKLSNNTIIHFDVAFPITQYGDQSYEINIFAEKQF